MSERHPARPPFPLTLAPLAEADAADLARAARASRALHAPWTRPPATTAKAAELARRRAGPADLAWLARDAASGAPAGYAELSQIARGRLCSAYLGYWAVAGFEGRGVMRWLLGRVLREQAFGALGLHRVEANIQPGNTASIALVRRLGFVREGLSPGYLRIGGRWRDHERWALRRDMPMQPAAASPNPTRPTTTMPRTLVSSGSRFEHDIGYSRAVVQDGWVFVSGTTGFDDATMIIAEGIEAQAAQCLRNIEAALAEAGATLADVVRVRYIVPDAAQFERCWPVLRPAFGTVRPAATMLSAALMDPRMAIEIEVTARVPAGGAG